MRRTTAGWLLLLAGMAGFGLGRVTVRPAESAGDDSAAILKADREFNLATQKMGAEGWASYFAEEGQMLAAGRDPVTGRAAIRASMAESFARPGFSIQWEPVAGAIARSGELGYTHGTSVIRTPDRDGSLQTLRGRYISVWRKDAGGHWRVVLDIGSSRAERATEKVITE